MSEIHLGIGYLGRRLLALAIDGGLALALTQVPAVGAALSVGFFLTRDLSPGRLLRLRSLRDRSPGKALMGLRLVSTRETGRISLRDSILRSMPLLLGVLLGVVFSPFVSMPEMGFGPALLRGPEILLVLLLGAIPVAGESLTMIKSPERRRWGDRAAGTRVTVG